MSRTRATAAARRPSTPHHPRRVSGPIRPGHPRPVAARPPRAVAPGGAVAAPRPRSGITGLLRALPDHRWLDTLLRSRAWIWLLGIGLGGIVAMQVSLLKMNAGIGQAVQASAALQHDNAKLEEQVAELSSGTRVSTAAAAMGLVAPDAGSVGYLRVRPGVDPMRAAQNVAPPSAQARAVLAGGGTAAPGTTATGTATGTTTTTTAAATGTGAATPAAGTTTTTTTAPATTTTTSSTTAAAPVATPAPTTTTTTAAPAGTGTAAPAADPTAGAAVAPAG